MVYRYITSLYCLNACSRVDTRESFLSADGEI